MRHDKHKPDAVSPRHDLVPFHSSVAAARPDSPRRGAPSKAGITPAFVLQALALWWTLALPVGLVLGSAAAATTWLTFQPTFVADTLVQIEDRRPYLAFQTQDESKRFVQTQVEIIRSRIVLGDLLSQPELAQMPELKSEVDPLAWLSSHVAVAGVGESELFRIKFTGPNPVNAAKIANAVAESYLKWHKNNVEVEVQEIIDELDKEKGRRVAELRRMQEHVRELNKKVTGKETLPPRSKRQENSAGPSPLAAITQRLTDEEVELEVLQAQLSTANESLERRAGMNVSQAALDQAVSSDATVQKLAAELTQTRLALEDYEHTSAQPKQLEAVRRLTARLADVEKALKERTAEVRTARTADLKVAMVQEKQEAVDKLEQLVENQQLRIKRLKDRLSEERATLEKSGDEALNLEFARDDMERAEEVFRRITERTTALQTERRAPSRVSVRSLATPPTAPDASPYKRVAAAGGGCLALPFVLALLWEYRVRRISNVEQLQDETRLQVVGEITSLPVRPLLPGRRGLTKFERHRSTFEESISYLRTSLMVGGDMTELQFIAVVSAISGEGKTSVAAQLASNLANTSGEPTLLIDADLRFPDVHDMFNVALQPGLAEVLEGQASLEEAIVATWSRRVQVMPAGQLKTNPHTLFASPAFTSLLSALRMQYRYIVVDCAPLLSASEALIVAKAADGALLCTMRDVSRLTQVQQARDRLQFAGARVLGVVLSGVSPSNYASRYGGYHYAAAQGGSDGVDSDANGSPI